jgi:hypothetical protein
MGQLGIRRSQRLLCFSTGLTIVSRRASELLWGMEQKSVGRYSAVGGALQLDAIYIKHRDIDRNDILPDVEACVPNVAQKRRLCQRRNTRTLADLKRELYLIQQAQNRFLVSRLRNTLDAYVNRYLNRASQMSALR